ncbi:uncharacterized protein LOC126668493 [Mercurialis annua]|uniref:uncharacterized protein LOC126668493 n=1 Tax=Mercurialis annua TaxID=3986 RepID=UPI00215FB4C0|nr:uncharacterized protein LOC126668493 [Mercurialis annua]
MYHDLKGTYWWSVMKKDVAEYVSKCLTCQQTLEDMLRIYVLDFQGSCDSHLLLIEFSYNNSYHASIEMAPYEALCGCKCRSSICWEEVPLIKLRLETSFSRHKSYVDPKRKDIEFQVCDFVFLRVAPMKGVICFGVKRMLAPRYVGPYEIIERIGAVTYKSALPPDLSLEQPVEIVDTLARKLRNKEIPMFKVLWRNHSVEECTWETECDMRNHYPFLFPEDSSTARAFESNQGKVLARSSRGLASNLQFFPSCSTALKKQNDKAYTPDSRDQSVDADLRIKLITDMIPRLRKYKD